jgi:GTP-binding protein EngB required for normal cell division
MAREIRTAVLLLGATGVGKSSFIAAATEKAVNIGHSLDPCNHFYPNLPTSFNSKVTDCFQGTPIPEGWEYVSADGSVTLVIDTPGFNDPKKRDLEVLQSIVGYIQTRNLKIISVIYFHRVTDKKITGSTKLNLRMLRAFCGEHFFQNIVLATTMWSAFPDASMEENMGREADLNTSDLFWADMIEKGALYVRWDETRRVEHAMSAEQILRFCMRKKDAPALNIMLELSEGKSLKNTTSGYVLVQELEEKRAKRYRDLVEEKDQMRALEQERAYLQENIQRATSSISTDKKMTAGHISRSTANFDDYGGYRVYDPQTTDPSIWRHETTPLPQHSRLSAGDFDRNSQESLHSGIRADIRIGRDFDSELARRADHQMERSQRPVKGGIFKRLGFGRQI